MNIHSLAGNSPIFINIALLNGKNKNFCDARYGQNCRGGCLHPPAGRCKHRPLQIMQPIFINKTKTRRPLPRLVFFKKKEKNRTSCRRLHRMETTPLQVDAVPWESAGRSGILPLLPIGKALQRLKRSLLSMPKYYTIFVEIARCGFIQPAINVTQYFVQCDQL